MSEPIPGHEAYQLAEDTIGRMDSRGGYRITDTIVIGMDPSGLYWVAGLTRERAVQIIVESMTIEDED